MSIIKNTIKTAEKLKISNNIIFNNLDKIDSVINKVSIFSKHLKNLKEDLKENKNENL